MPTSTTSRTATWVSSDPAPACTEPSVARSDMNPRAIAIFLTSFGNRPTADWFRHGWHASPWVCTCVASDATAVAIAREGRSTAMLCCVAGPTQEGADDRALGFRVAPPVPDMAPSERELLRGVGVARPRVRPQEVAELQIR